MAFTPLQQNWRWYADDGAEPTTALGAENTFAILADLTRLIRLRVTVNNTGSTAGNNKAITVEYSTDNSSFTAFGSGNAWNYADGQATGGNTTTTFKTSDASTHHHYHENGTTNESWTSGIVGEMDIAIAPTATVLPGTKYFFRVLQAGTAIALNTGKSHPSVMNPIVMPKGSIGETGQALILAFAYGLGLGSIALSGQSVGVSFTGPNVGSLGLTGQVLTPSINSGGGSPVVVDVPAGGVVLQGQTSTQDYTWALPAGFVGVLGQSVGVSFTGPDVGHVAYTGYDPGLIIALGPVIGVPAGAVTIAGQALTPISAVSVGVPQGVVGLSGQTLAVERGIALAAGVLALQGQTSVQAFTTDVPAGAVGFTGRALAPEYAISIGAGELDDVGQVLTPQISGQLAIPAGQIGFVGQTPTVTFAGPGAGSLVLQGQAPTLATTVGFPAGSLAYSGTIPGLNGAQILPIPAGTLDVVGQSVGVSFLGPDIGHMVWTGLAPTVTIGTVRPIDVPAGSLAWTGQDVGVSFIGPANGSLVLQGYAPVVSKTNSITVLLPAGSLALSGHYIGIAFRQPSEGQLVFTGYAPVVAAGGNVTRTMGLGGIQIEGPIPVPTTDRIFRNPAGSLVWAGQALVVSSGGSLNIAVPAGSVGETGQTVGVSFTGPANGQIVFTGLVPTVARTTNPAIAIPAGSLVLSGQYVGVEFIQPVPGSVVFTGYAPVVASGHDIVFTFSAGSLVLAGRQTDIFTPGFIAPGLGQLALVGYPLAIIPVKQGHIELVKYSLNKYLIFRRG